MLLKCSEITGILEHRCIWFTFGDGTMFYVEKYANPKIH